LKTSSSYSFAAGQLSKTDTSVLFHFVDFLVVAHGVLVLFQVHVALGAPQVGLDVRLVEADGLVAVAQRLFQFVHLDEDDGAVEVELGVGRPVVGVDGQRRRVRVEGLLEAAVLERLVALLLFALEQFRPLPHQRQRKKNTFLYSFRP